MKIKNTSGSDLIVPWLNNRLVFDGQVVEVPGEGFDGVFAYTQQESTWAPADEEAQAVHDGVLADLAALLGIETSPKKAGAKKAAAKDAPTPPSGDDKPQEG